MLLIKKAIREKFDNPETTLNECELLIQESKQIGLHELAEDMEKDLLFEVKNKYKEVDKIEFEIHLKTQVFKNIPQAQKRIYEEVYNNKPTHEDKQAYERAFQARLAYERRCSWKYDRPCSPSLPVKKGDRMEDFAVKYGTTVKEMKDCEMAVDKAMNTVK